jgi:hypothetical protein
MRRTRWDYKVVQFARVVTVSSTATTRDTEQGGEFFGTPYGGLQGQLVLHY